MAKRKPRKLSDQVRQAILESGMSRYAIWKRTGIDQAALSKFMHGERGLSTRALDALGECLGLRITREPKPADRKGR